MKLAAYLAREGLNYSQFGERIGVAHTTVMRIATEQLEPRVELRAKIVAATNGEVGELDLIKRVVMPEGEAAA